MSESQSPTTVTGTPVHEPFPEYEAETTTDATDVPSVFRASGDGVYNRDSETIRGDKTSLTKHIAEITTKHGGRIPVDFSASTQNDGYARLRSWRVYAPSDNPYRIAAEITDKLEETASVDSINVDVTVSGRELTNRVRRELERITFSESDNSGRVVFEDELNTAMRLIRWFTGVPRADRDAVNNRLEDDVQRLTNNLDGLYEQSYSDFRDDYNAAHNYPGDAQDFTRINIDIHEEADKQTFF